MYKIRNPLCAIQANVHKQVRSNGCYLLEIEALLEDFCPSVQTRTSVNCSKTPECPSSALPPPLCYFYSTLFSPA